MTSAIFEWSGKIPRFNERLIMWASRTVKNSHECFTITGEITLNPKESDFIV